MGNDFVGAEKARNVDSFGTPSQRRGGHLKLRWCGILQGNGGQVTRYLERIMFAENFSTYGACHGYFYGTG